MPDGALELLKLKESPLETDNASLSLEDLVFEINSLALEVESVTIPRETPCSTINESNPPAGGCT